MFLVVIVVLALALGLRRGSLRNLADTRLRWLWIPPAAFGLQALLINFPVLDPLTSARIGPSVVAGTYAAVAVFLVANRSQPGARLVLAGAGLNLVVMIANGGYMPVTTEALQKSGHLDQQVVRGEGTFVHGSKDVVLPGSEIQLRFLADALSLPRPIPLAASFSLGDILIVLGASQFAYTSVSRPRKGTGVTSSRIGGKLVGGEGGFKGRGDDWTDSMSAETMHGLIGRALTDRTFRENLLRNPNEAIREYPLSRSERAIIASLQASCIEEFSQKLDKKLDEANPGRAMGS